MKWIQNWHEMKFSIAGDEFFESVDEILYLDHSSQVKATERFIHVVYLLYIIFNILQMEVLEKYFKTIRWEKLRDKGRGLSAFDWKILSTKAVVKCSSYYTEAYI